LLAREAITFSELAQLAYVEFSVEKLLKVLPHLQCLGDFAYNLKNVIFCINILISLLDISHESFSFLVEWQHLVVLEALEQL
jgi:hypothetical protein